jgi:integrase
MSKKTRIDTALSDDELEILLPVINRILRTESTPANQRPALLALVALYTGLRVSELRRLRIEDFDWATNECRVYRHKKHGSGYQKGVPYSGAMRDTIKLPAALAQQLKAVIERWPTQSGPLFVSRRGKTACRRTLEYDWEHLLHRAGLYRGMRPGMYAIHGARHTFATQFIEVHPDDPIALQQALAHESLDMVLQYVANRPKVIELAVNDMFNLHSPLQLGVMRFLGFYVIHARPRRNFATIAFSLLRDDCQ